MGHIREQLFIEKDCRTPLLGHLDRRRGCCILGIVTNWQAGLPEVEAYWCNRSCCLVRHKGDARPRGHSGIICLDVAVCTVLVADWGALDEAHHKSAENLRCTPRRPLKSFAPEK